MPYIATNRANSLRKAKGRAMADASTAADKAIALKIAEALPSRAKAKGKARPKVMVRVRVKVKVQLKGVRVPKVDALHVVDHTMHLHARKGKVAARPLNWINKGVGNKTHGEHQANREPITLCPNHWDPTGPRECIHWDPTDPRERTQD